MSDPNILIGDLPGTSIELHTMLSPDDYTRLKHRKRYWGGHWDLTFFLAEADIQGGLLDEWFNSWLMGQVVEYFGGAITWRGVIWEMVRIKDGKRQQRSMSNVYNAVKCVYTRVNSSVQVETPWQINDDSISRYLRKELIIYKDNIGDAQAVDEANAALMVAYDAWAQSTDFNTSSKDGLEITVLGMGRLLNNIFCTQTTPTGLIRVDSFIQAIWSNDLAPNFDFLIFGGVDSNPLEVEREQRAPTRCGDLIDALARGGNASTPYRWYIGADLQFRFQIFDNEPTMEWRGMSRGGIFLKGGGRITWDANPGVLDDVTLPAVPAISGDFLQQRNHEIIQQFSMWQGQSGPKPELEQLTEAQLLADLDAYRRMITDGNFDRLHTPGASPGM